MLSSCLTIVAHAGISCQAGTKPFSIVFSYQLTDDPRYAPLTAAVLGAIEAGQVAGLPTPDAIQVAAARLAGAGALVTNDRRWARQVTQPALILLDDYVD